MSRLYLRLMCWMIASSILSPPTRTLFAKTMPASEMTATSLVPPDVDDHVPGRLGDGEPRADRRGHRLLDQVDLARAGRLGRLADRPALHLRDAAGDPDDDARLHQGRAVVRRADEVPQHRGGDLEVGDHPVLHRAD